MEVAARIFDSRSAIKPMWKFHLMIPGILVACGPSALAAGNDWMSPLDGALPISQLSIPGAHDAGARFEPLSGTSKCQNLTITGQLEAGVRFLDIRCRHQNDLFNIYHGLVDQKATYASVLTEVLNFLVANPRETVTMSVKEEESSSACTRSFEATFDSYISQNPDKWLLVSNVPTLDAARGKIVLFRRFRASSTPKGIDASVWSDNTSFSIGGTLRVQDNYVVPDNDAKWASILTLLDEARHGGPDTLYVNFTSGYQSGRFGIPSITTVSNDIQPRLTTFFTSTPTGRFGIVLMDFADAAKAALIYKTNAPSH
jgi:1-phosphatidylinositol phosphodiesterase